MKTKTILFILLLISGMMSAQDVKRVAILETVDKENKVSYANKLILRANLSKAITNTAGYEAYDRTDIDAIMGEQNFQRTGMVSNEQIKRLGEMTGANYILVAEAVVVDAKTMFITAKLLDVETARTILTDNLIMGTTTDEIQEGCVTLAKRLFHEENSKVAHNRKVVTSTSMKQMAEPDLITNVLERHSKSEQKLMGVKEYTYGNMQLDEKAFQKFLQSNNRSAYMTYMKGQKLKTAGWWVFGSGATLLTLGSIIAIINESVLYGHPVIGDATYAALALGAATTIASIPFFSIGARHRNKTAIDVFNEQNSTQSQLTLNLQASQNGIGLALNF